QQLQEVMTDFWFNHFNVFSQKGADMYLLPGYERDVIRPNALGKFKDVVQAVAQSPAMLFYLDNWLSTAPDAVRPKAPTLPSSKPPEAERRTDEYIFNSKGHSSVLAQAWFSEPGCEARSAESGTEAGAAGSGS